MDKLTALMACDDGSCCCIPPRNTTFLISILSMVVCLVDLTAYDSSHPCCKMKDYVEGLRFVLTLLFQTANMSLLMSFIVDSALLVNIYLWYSLGFIVMGLCLAILDLLFQIKHEVARGIVSFTLEVAFLFVISRCLPIVDTYRKLLDDQSARNTYQ